MTNATTGSSDKNITQRFTQLVSSLGFIVCGGHTASEIYRQTTVNRPVRYTGEDSDHRERGLRGSAIAPANLRGYSGSTASIQHAAHAVLPNILSGLLLGIPSLRTYFAVSLAESMKPLAER